MPSTTSTSEGGRGVGGVGLDSWPRGPMAWWAGTLGLWWGRCGRGPGLLAEWWALLCARATPCSPLSPWRPYLHPLEPRASTLPAPCTLPALPSRSREWGRLRRRLRVEFAKNDSNVREREKARRDAAIPNKTLFVAGFDPRTIRTRDLEEAFERHGKLRVRAGGRAWGRGTASSPPG